MFDPKNFTISGQYPPTVINSPTTGIRYAISGSTWIQIPTSMSREEVHKGWINPYTPRQIEQPKMRGFRVPSASKPEIKYLVRVLNDIWDCECVGFGWRRNCDHIRRAKEYLANKENTKE